MPTQAESRLVITEKDKVSIELMSEIISESVSNFEKKLKSSISKIIGKKSSEVDQGSLMKVQANVQTWGVLITAGTGIIRGLGDGLKSTVQNIR